MDHKKFFSFVNRLFPIDKKRGCVFLFVPMGLLPTLCALQMAILPFAAANFAKAREKAQCNACIDNLRMIEGACEQLKMEGEVPSAEKLYGPGKYIKVEPRCPADPSKPYVIPTGDERPKCPNADRFPNHKLP